MLSIFPSSLCLVLMLANNMLSIKLTTLIVNCQPFLIVSLVYLVTVSSLAKVMIGNVREESSVNSLLMSSSSAKSQKFHKFVKAASNKCNSRQLIRQIKAQTLQK